MKSKNSFKYILCHLFVISLFFGVISCDDNTNDWPVDSSYDRLFKPLIFEQAALGASQINISFSKVIGASKYVFEFSEDSLQFTNITRTVEILTDTLTPFANSTVATKVIYLLNFNELSGSTLQSVRMKAFDKDGKSSDFVQFAFTTPPENIFGDAWLWTNKLTLSWTPTDRVTNIKVVEDATGAIIFDGALSDQEITDASKTVTDLKMGTYYTFTIYNNDKVRGIRTLKTSGTVGSESYDVQPGDDVAAVLTEFSSLGKTNVTLNFQNGVAYDLASLTIPAGMVQVTFTAPSGEKPILNINKISTTSTMDGLLFEYVSLIGVSNATSRLIDTGVGIRNISFVGCYISDYQGVIRLTNSAMIVDKITMDKCWINNTGTYGIFNVGGIIPQMGTIELTESTLTNIGTQVTDIRNPIKSVIVRNCTFYNNEAKYSQFFRFDANNLPISVTVESCILAGKNGENKVHSTYASYPTLGLSFGGSYKTKEFPENTRVFTDITTFSGTAYDLFTDPDNGDFTIKQGAGFAGTGSTGDPRWY